MPYSQARSSIYSPKKHYFCTQAFTHASMLNQLSLQFFFESISPKSKKETIMNNISTHHFMGLIMAGGLALTAIAGNYTTAGDGTTHTLSSLAKIAGSGVSRQGNVITITDSVTIAQADKFKLEDGLTVCMGEAVVLRINGQAMLEVANGTTFTAIAGTTPFTVQVWDMTQETRLKNITFDQVGFRGPGKAFVVDHCTFTHFNGANKGHSAFNMNGENSHYTFTNCHFERNQYSAIASGANLHAPVSISDCKFIANGVSGKKYPQLNLTVADSVIVRGCTVQGDPTFDKVGGIAVSNMLGKAGNHFTLIENNIITHNSYGITTLGLQSAVIKNNIIAHNTHIANAMLGGSGISVSNTGAGNNIIITGNNIEDNLWGITAIGLKGNHINVNMGKTGNPAASDYNPGDNVFKNNGNGGTLYDLYNNSPDTIYAQGNTWNVVVQDSISIEKVITHKPDIASLGLVVFMPAHNEQSAIHNAQVARQAIETRYYNLAGLAVKQPLNGIYIAVTRYNDGTAQSKKVVR